MNNLLWFIENKQMSRLANTQLWYQVSLHKQGACEKNTAACTVFIFLQLTAVDSRQSS